MLMGMGFQGLGSHVGERSRTRAAWVLGRPCRAELNNG